MPNRLTFDDAYVEMVDVSRDGERVIISSDRAGNRTSGRCHPAGGRCSKRRSTRLPLGSWLAPDGKEIAFYAVPQWSVRSGFSLSAGVRPDRSTRSEVESSYPDWVTADGRGDSRRTRLARGSNAARIVAASGGEDASR